MFGTNREIIDQLDKPVMGRFENSMNGRESIRRVVKWGLFLVEQDICVDENSKISSTHMDFEVRVNVLCWNSKRD